VDARRLRWRAAEPGALIALQVGAQECAVSPVVEVDGAVLSVSDAGARVVAADARSLEVAWRGGVRALLRVHRDGAAWVATVDVSASRAVTVDGVGVRIDGVPSTRVLVDGFHSWDWAGVRDATVPGRGWWGGVIGGRICVSLHSPPLLGPPLLRWSGNDAFDAVITGAPDQLAHLTAPPRGLGLALRRGRTLRADAIRIAPLVARAGHGAGLPLPRSRDHNPGPRVAGWMSWNCLGPAATAADVLDAARTLVPPRGLVLLDDGWMPHWGDWTERDDFDSSLLDLADAVHAAGRRFGLWLAPFMVDQQSRAASTHAALLLRDKSGAPVVLERTSHPQYVLDASLRATRAHLGALGRRLGRLRIDALKLDFLFAGALPGMRAQGSDIAALHSGIEALVRGYRTTAPRGARVLACGAPAAPLVGLVDSCRSGGDSVVNVPAAGATSPARPLFAHGEALLRSQVRNFAARAWLWGATVPPDVDAVTLGAVGEMPSPSDGYAQSWLELARVSGGPLLDADVPDGRITAERLQVLNDAQQAVIARPPRPMRSRDPLAGSAVDHDDADFHEWPDQLPPPWDQD
jgi:alpha-galactosidase